jgi:hypothetical protein
MSAIENNISPGNEGGVGKWGFWAKNPPLASFRSLSIKQHDENLRKILLKPLTKLYGQNELFIMNQVINSI